ncbi:hypothetical protein TSAR_011241 [Trichomalopsis sarcophagae]|uniref:Uncharacterized protein n=1 Tax=Trichomalopsis sarcophagae TaxID=543379 RepID=A0A232ENC2_9HYME|nr:hypothetical protein TSAR_011241 [Trichomalopsis sarcophagae]
MASGKRIDIFALCIFFLYINLDRGVLGVHTFYANILFLVINLNAYKNFSTFDQYSYDYAGNITVLNISANTYDPNNSYFWIDDQDVPNERLWILKPVGQDASDNLTINQYSDTGNGKVRQGGESAICSFFQNRDDPRVQADLEARTIFTILFPTQQNCPFTNTTNLVPAGYSTVFNYDGEVSCDSWIYVLEIPDPNNKDSPYLTVTLQIDMEKIYKCGESIPVEVVPPSESGSIGNQVCDRLSSDGSNLTLSLVYATGRDNEFMVTQDVNIARNEYNIDVLHTYDRYFFASYFNIFFFTKNSIDDESPQLLYTNSICNLISSDKTEYPPGFFPSVVTRMVFPDRDSCRFENKTAPIISNQTVTETPALNPGITFPDIPRWYLLVNIVLQRNISNPLHGYIIQILYAVDQDGLENSKECIPPEKSSEEVPTTQSTISNQESGVLTTPPTISSEQVSSPETESSAISQEVPTTPPTVSNQESGVLTTPPTISSEQVSSSDTESSAISQEVPTTPPTVSNQESGQVSSPETESSAISQEVPTTPPTISSEQTSSSETESSAISQEVPTTPPTVSNQESGVLTTPSTISSEQVSSPETESSAISQEVPTTPPTVSNQESGETIPGQVVSSEQVSSEIVSSNESKSSESKNSTSLLGEVEQKVEGGLSDVTHAVEDIGYYSIHVPIDIVSWILEAIYRIIYATIYGVTSGAHKVEGGVEYTVDGTGDAIEKVIDTVEDSIKDAYNTTKNNIVNTIDTVEDGYDDVKSVIKGFIDDIRNLLEGTLRWTSFIIRHPITGTEDGIKDIFSTITNKIEDGFSDVERLASDGVNDVESVVSNVVSGAEHGVSSAISTVTNGVIDVVKGGITGTENAAKDVYNGAKDAVEGTINFVEHPIDGTEDIISGIKTSITNLGDKIVGTITGSSAGNSSESGAGNQESEVGTTNNGNTSKGKESSTLASDEDKSESLVGKTTDTLIDTVFNTINLLIDAGSETKSLVSNALTDITNETETVGSRVINLAEDGFSGTGSILGDIVHKIQGTLSGALNHVNLILHSPVSGIEDSLSAMISWIVNTVSELVSGTFNTARNGERDVQDAITNTADEIGSMGGSLISETGGEVKNLTSGLYKTVSFVLSNLTNEIEESTGKAAKRLFKSINKTVMQTIPDDIFNTIYDAANDTTEAVIKDCQWFDLGITNNCIFYYAYDAIKIPIELVIDSISEIISLVTDAALLPVTLPLDLVEAPVNIPIDIAELAVSIPTDIVKYVTEAVADIGGPIVNLAGDITNYLGGKLSSGAKEAESVVSDVGGRIFKALKKGFKMYL